MLDLLQDGEYWATCRERTRLAASANGYGPVFPQAKMTVKDGWATFERDGKAVWDCNARFAAAHFDVRLE